MTGKIEASVNVDAILQLSGANRAAKAYAFLYAAFKRTEISKNPVRDALDCLTPFAAPYLSAIAGKQVSVEGIQKSLKEFGFDIPIYALEQLMPELQRAGYVEYNKKLHAYIAKKQDTQFDVAKSEIEVDFDEVVGRLAAYAKELGFDIAPPSGSWGDALIAFLKSSADRPLSKIQNIKGALVDPGKAETAAVASFIARLHSDNPPIFSKLLNIFMGVLVEEFISSMAEIGGVEAKKPVHIMYDTAVLLRLLGCSGKLLRVATEELTTYLQDLNFNIFFFRGNEAEVSNILDTIVHLKDAGKELEGETAAAISAGETSITHLRLLQNNVPERLARSAIFSADDLEKSAHANAKHQIDEKAFAEYLKKKALEKGRLYGQQNRENDARYLGDIMRLRGRSYSRDLASCGYIFVTSNKFLAQMSRKFLIEQKAIQPQHVPPMLSVGQIATIAWLLRDKALEPEKAGRELLANCFAAVRPDHEWFKYFREGIEKVTGDIEEYGDEPRHALALQAARRIAQEESFGESAIVRELNMVEILQRAEAEAGRLLEQKDAEIVAQSEEAIIAREQAVQDAVLETRRAERNARIIARARRARSLARTSMNIVKAMLVIIFAALTFWSISLQRSGNASSTLWVLTIAFALINIFSVMDLLKVPVAERVIGWFEEFIFNKWDASLAAISDDEDVRSPKQEPSAE